MNIDDFRLLYDFQRLGEPSHARCLRAARSPSSSRATSDRVSASVRDTLAHIYGGRMDLARTLARSHTGRASFRRRFPGFRVGAAPLE